MPRLAWFLAAALPPLVALGGLRPRVPSTTQQDSGAVRETVLLELPGGVEPELGRKLACFPVIYARWWTIWGSSDNRRVAVLARRGGSKTLLGPGIPPAEYEDIEYAAFSPDGARLAVIARRSGWHVVVDGVEGPGYDAIKSLVFSPDSRRLVYAARSGSTWSLVENGRAGGAYQDLAWVRFGPVSQRLVYAARRRDRWVVVRDGTEGPEWDAVYSPTFSGDGEHLAYAARRGDTWRIVVDGREGAPFSNVTWAVLSRDGSRTGYVAVVPPGDSAPRVEYLGRFEDARRKAEHPERVFLMDASPRPRPTWWAPVLDGAIGAPAPAVVGPIFDTSGSRAMFLAGDNVWVGVFLDGRKLLDFRPSDVNVRGVSFAAPIALQSAVATGDLSQVALIHETWAPWVMSGSVFRAGPPFARAATIRLSDTGAAVTEGPVHESNRIRLSGIWNAQFSPDGRHFGYEVLEGGRPDHRVVLDLRPEPAYDQVLCNSLRVAGDSAVYVARRGNRVLRVSRALEAR